MRGNAWFSKWLRTNPTPTPATGSAKRHLAPRSHVPERLIVRAVLAGKPGTSAGDSRV